MELTLLKLLLCLFGLLLSAYFSAVEISLLSANRWKLQQEARTGSAGALLALGLLRQQEQVIATTLVGVNIANLATASIATSLIEARFGVSWQSTLLSTVVITFVILVVGEIVPKVYGKQMADRLLVLMARPVLATEQLLLPITGILRLYLAGLIRLFRRAPRRPVLTREELKSLVHEVRSDSGPGRKEQQMLRSILDFGETTAREVMVPMTEVIAVERESSVELLRALVNRHGFTQIPIYARRIDRMIGLVNIYNLLFDPKPKDELTTYIRPVLLTPETKRIDRLLFEMQREGQTLAVVVSEFGSCVGILTVEDIVEEIVGEIAEEHEVGVRKIRRVAPRTYVVNALTDVDDINEQLLLELPKGRYDTVAGLVLTHFGRIPREGESFEVDQVRIEVIDVHAFGVRSVKLTTPMRADEVEADA